jgi:hypothetical protein
MAIDPNLIMTGLSGLAGLFSKGPKWDENQKRQMRIAGDFENYGRGVPGSDPAEMASLAQGRALIGQDQLNARNRMYGALSPNATTDLGDFMRNMESSQQAQRSSFDLEQLLGFINARRQALLSSAQISGSVGAKGGGTQNNLPQLVGQYMYQRELNKAYQQPKAQGGGGGQAPPPAGFGGLFGGPPGSMAPKAAAQPGGLGSMAAAFGGLMNREAAAGPGPAMGAMPSFGGFMSQGAPGPTFPGGMTPQAGALTGPNQRRYGPPRSRTRY